MVACARSHASGSLRRGSSRGKSAFSGAQRRRMPHGIVWDMTADLTPAEAEAKEDQGGGWRLKADKSGLECLSTVHLFLEFAEAVVQRRESSAQKSKAIVMSDRPCYRRFERMDVQSQRFGWDFFTGSVWGLCRMILFGSPVWPRGISRLSHSRRRRLSNPRGS